VCVHLALLQIQVNWVNFVKLYQYAFIWWKLNVITQTQVEEKETIQRYRLQWFKHVKYMDTTRSTENRRVVMKSQRNRAKVEKQSKKKWRRRMCQRLEKMVHSALMSLTDCWKLTDRTGTQYILQNIPFTIADDQKVLIETWLCLCNLLIAALCLLVTAATADRPVYTHKCTKSLRDFNFRWAESLSIFAQ